MDSSRRRRFLQTVAGVSTIGLAGCNFLSSEQPGENQEEPPEITDTPASTPTSTPVPVPDDASFSFDYSGGSLTIRLTGGGPIPASNLVIRSSEGAQVRWHELGSTAVPASGSVTSGDTATIGSSVLNWPNAVEQSETIRVVFMTEGGSPTTLETFEPSAEETPTETETPEDTETPTETPSGSVTVDSFEDGNTSGWNPSSPQTSSFEGSQERAFSGSWAAELSGGSENNTTTWEKVGEEVSPTTVETAHALENGELYADSFTEWRLGDTTILRVNYNWSNNFLAVNGSGATASGNTGAVVSNLPWSSSEGFFHVVLDDIRWGSNEVGEVRVNGTVEAEDVPFFNNADSIDRAAVFIGGHDGNVMFIDDTTVPLE